MTYSSNNTSMVIKVKLLSLAFIKKFYDEGEGLLLNCVIGVRGCYEKIDRF